MADNTPLNVGAGGDKIRTLDRGRADGAKVEVVQLDFGGGDAGTETLVTPQTPLPAAFITPQPVALDGAQFDDDGIIFFNPNAPSADISTGTLQTQILNAVVGRDGTGLQPLSVAIGVASVAVVGANPLRSGLILINTSTTGQIIYLGLEGALAVVGSGITLWPGDGWTMDRYSYMDGAINGIASAAAGSMAIQEFS